jgi:hypothetical protein
MRKLVFLLTIIFSGSASFAQLQVGIFGGIANYVGDLTDKPYQNSRGVVGLTFGYPLSNRINLRAGISFAKVAGADSLLAQQDLRLRNLSFQSPITEFSLVGEFNTFDMTVKRWSPYVFGGLALYHFNPYTFDQSGNKVYLQPLGTEGQGLPGYEKQYSLTQLAIPFGGGIKYDISEKVRLAFEVGLRKLFTDYLDDVSGKYADVNELLAARGHLAVDLSYREDELPGGDPSYPLKGWERGSPKYKDYYYFTGLHLIFRIPQGDGERSYRSPASKNKRYGCPTVF